MQQKRKITSTVKFSSPIQYGGNLFFLILFLIIWLPVGLLLLIRNVCISKNSSKFYITYQGSWGWLFFWGILFFPISILFICIKGVNLVEEETVIEQEAVVERYE